VQLSSSGSGSSSNIADGDNDSAQCSDSYFDDEFASERILSRHRHLRLQTTLALDDRPASVNLSDEFHSPVVTRAPLQQRRTPEHRGVTASGQKTKSAARDGATSLAEGIVVIIIIIVIERFNARPVAKRGLTGSKSAWLQA